MSYNDKRRSQLNKNHIEKTLKAPERRAAEEIFALAHANDSDEQLLEYVLNEKRRLGKKMKPVNTIGYTYLLERLGPWSVFISKVNLILEEEKKAAQAGGSDNE